jgi:hypothetical protein
MVDLDGDKKKKKLGLLLQYGKRKMAFCLDKLMEVIIMQLKCFQSCFIAVSHG